MIITGDALESLRTLPDESVQCCVTSPPYYGLRDYGVDGQIGLEETPEEYIDRMVAVFREVRRVLRGDGTLWVNMGDSYASGGRSSRDPGNSRLHPAFQGDAATRNFRPLDGPGIKPKDLLGMPWRLAFALQADGWYLRQDIIWAKPNPMPESVRDRCTKAHEYVFLLSKSERYYYDADAISESASDNTHARYKSPDGWDTSTGGGGHGSFHKNGREKGSTALSDASPKYRDSKDPRHRSKAGLAASARKFKPRKLADPGSGTKNNGSFDAAMAVMPARRNKRSVWTIASEPYPEAHFATFPTELPRICILAGSRVGDLVLDPFNGSGTTGQVAIELARWYVGIELNPAYVDLTRRRLARVTPGLPFGSEVAENGGPA